MRIANLSSTRPPGRKAYVRGFQPLASVIRLIALAAPLLLCTQSVTASAGGRPAHGRRYDCTLGGELPRDESGNKWVKEGIGEAKKILRDCRACRQFYGSDDPLDRLEELEDMKAIFVSERVPNGERAPEPPWGFTKFISFQEMEVKLVAAIIELDPFKTSGEFVKPCIYVNPAAFLAADLPVEGGGYDGLPPAQARGLAILHELAHAMDVIPSDGVIVQTETRKGRRVIKRSRRREDRSVENTKCIRNNCLPCAEQCMRCLVKPPRHPSHKHCAPLAPARRASIIKSFRRLSCSGLALGS